MQMLKFSGATVVAISLMAASVSAGAYAQVPVAAGAGSYASTPPTYKREFGIINAIKKLNRQLEKVAYSFGNFTDI